MFIVNVGTAIKKMTVIEIIEFIFENYYKKLDFLKKTVIF